VRDRDRRRFISDVIRRPRIHFWIHQKLGRLRVSTVEIGRKRRVTNEYRFVYRDRVDAFNSCASIDVILAVRSLDPKRVFQYQKRARRGFRKDKKAMRDRKIIKVYRFD
jgi:hypothetical protein